MSIRQIINLSDCPSIRRTNDRYLTLRRLYLFDILSRVLLKLSTWFINSSLSCWVPSSSLLSWPPGLIPRASSRISTNMCSGQQLAVVGGVVIWYLISLLCCQSVCLIVVLSELVCLSFYSIQSVVITKIFIVIPETISNTFSEYGPIFLELIPNSPLFARVQSWIFLANKLFIENTHFLHLCGFSTIRVSIALR